MKHGHCGEACIPSSKFALFKVFEKNLTIADGSTGYKSCADLGWPKYRETVTHGDPLHLLTCTLDLYDRRGHNVHPREHAKGFVRMPRNDAVPVATITDSMRASAPSKLDWTTSGATSPVKNQGMCGSCWAFSATEGIESAVFRATGTMQVLSTQQIISCDKVDGGCNGGDLPTAFDYVESDGGIDSNSDYPDKSHRFGFTGQCKPHSPIAKVTDYKYAVAPCEGGSCSSQAEDDLKAALNSFGPLSICVNADWDNYDGGVFADSCSGSYNALDHCVQLVGYDTTAATPYWIVRNSWGPSWGEKGHIWLPMGQNSCGIADEVMYVTAEMASVVV